MHARNLLLTSLALGAVLATAEAQEDPTADGKKIELYLSQLRGNDPIARSDASIGLSRLGPKAKSAVPELIKMLGETVDIGNAAVTILGAIGPDAKAAVPALIGRMKHKSASVRV